MTEPNTTVQIATLVVGLISTCFMGWIAYLTAKVNAGQREAAKKVEEVAIKQDAATAMVADVAVKQEAAVANAEAKAEEVRKTLEESAIRGGRRMDDLREEAAATRRTGEAVHALVNGGHGVLLKLLATALRRVADGSGQERDIKEAELAEKAHTDHVAMETGVQK